MLLLTLGSRRDGRTGFVSINLRRNGFHIKFGGIILVTNMSHRHRITMPTRMWELWDGTVEKGFVIHGSLYWFNYGFSLHRNSWTQGITH